MGTLTSAGFKVDTEEEWVAALKADWLAEFGDETDVSDESPDGILIRFMSRFFAKEDELVEGVYQASSRGSAFGNALTNLGKLLGINRKPATKSYILSPGATILGTAGAVIPSGTRFSVSGTGAQVEITSDVTIGVDGTVTVSVYATSTGPVQVASGTLDTLDDQVIGLTGISNSADAELGDYEESNEALRARMRRTVAAAGSGTGNALEAKFGAISGVKSVRVIDNDTDAVVDGQDTHSFQVVIFGGADSDIAEAVWANKIVGIRSYGTTSAQTPDASGNDQTVYFTRPTETPIRIKSTLTTSAAFPVDGAAQVKRAILLQLADGLKEADVLADTVTTGAGKVSQDVLSGLVVAAIYSVPGVLSHTGPLIDDDNPPTATGNYAIGESEVATYDVLDMDIS